MKQDKLLNIENMPDLTNWIKAITWKDTNVFIRYADLKRHDFVKNNAFALAKMMSHSYIKRNISYYLNELIGTPALKPIAPDAEMTESVRAAVLAGYPAIHFDSAKVPENFTKKICRLNDFLINSAKKYISDQTANKSDTFSFDIQYLIKQFPDYNMAMNRSRWYIKTSSLEKDSDMLQNISRER